MIRLVVLDVDGTLTDRERRISTDAIINIRRAVNSGVLISFVSGNALPVMFGLKTFIGTNAPVFGENGGIVLINDTIKTFFSKEKCDKFLDEISKTTSARPMFTNIWRQTSSAFTMDEKDYEFISKEAEKRDLYIVNSKFTWHVMNKGQDKAYAVNFLKEYYNYDYKEILVMGDSDNDLSMFDPPVKKAAPANASENIKEKSEYVSEFAYGAQVGDVFKYFGII